MVYINRPATIGCYFASVEGVAPFGPENTSVCNMTGHRTRVRSPEEMFSGQSVWKFKLSNKASGQGTLRKMIPIWDLTGGGETRTADTPHGRLTLSRYGNLTMLDGGRIENLPLDTVVREFKFGPKDYKRVGPAKNSSPPPPPNKGLQRTPR